MASKVMRKRTSAICVGSDGVEAIRELMRNLYLNFLL